MKRLYVKNREEWRTWLSGHHDTGTGIWLVFFKKQTGKPSVEYGDSVEEALCFGWIDSIIKKIDEARYVRKFTPRKESSRWSELNKKRAAKMIEEGRMTEFGMAKIEAAKSRGKWDTTDRPEFSFDLPPELKRALSKNQKAKQYFESLAPTYRKHFIAWIATAKRAETKKRRVRESITLLENGKKLGLK